MREIKFRGKHINTNEWIFGDCINEQPSRFIRVFPQITKFYVIPESVCEYIGLKDKNGNEIYEGDIVKVPATLNDNINILYVVFKKGSFLYWSPNQDNGVFVSKIDNNTIEIIGNIQDNPELLK